MCLYHSVLDDHRGAVNTANERPFTLPVFSSEEMLRKLSFNLSLSLFKSPLPHNFPVLHRQFCNGGICSPRPEMIGGGWGWSEKCINGEVMKWSTTTSHHHFAALVWTGGVTGTWEVEIWNHWKLQVLDYNRWCCSWSIAFIETWSYQMIWSPDNTKCC